MNSEADVLKFFRDNLPEQGTFTGKRIPLGIDDVLQDYTDLDDIIYAIERFESIVSKLTLKIISPGLKPGFRKWFTKEPVKQISKPLTVRMFAEAVKAGKWIHD
jgi:hypothetical protein